MPEERNTGSWEFRGGGFFSEGNHILRFLRRESICRPRNSCRGGGDSGITEAMLLSRIAKKVTVLELFPSLNATIILQERVSSDPKIEIKCGVKIEAVCGDDQVRSINLCDAQTGAKSVLEVGGILVSVGREPNTAYLGNSVALDQSGQIIVNEYMEPMSRDFCSR